MSSRTALLAAGVAGLVLTGAAQGQEKTFDLTGFTGIDIATGLDANVTLAHSFSIRAHSRSADALDNLDLSVRDGVLIARIHSSFLDFILGGGLVGMLFTSGNAVTLDITLPALDSASASSGADVTLSGITADRLALDASSGANIALTQARLRSLTANASSGSDIEMSGSAEEISLDASSGSDIDAEALEAMRGQLQASSGANINARLTGEVRASASSGGDIEIEGNPPQRDVDSSSGGDVSFD